MTKTKNHESDVSMVLEQLQKEVDEEFLASKHEAYKEGLHSIISDIENLNREKERIDYSINRMQEKREKLDEAFKDGTLRDKEDLRNLMSRY